MKQDEKIEQENAEEAETSLLPLLAPVARSGDRPQLKLKSYCRERRPWRSAFARNRPTAQRPFPTEQTNTLQSVTLTHALIRTAREQVVTK